MFFVDFINSPKTEYFNRFLLVPFMAATVGFFAVMAIQGFDFGSFNFGQLLLATLLPAIIALTHQITTYFVKNKKTESSELSTNEENSQIYRTLSALIMNAVITAIVALAVIIGASLALSSTADVTAGLLSPALNQTLSLLYTAAISIAAIFAVKLFTAAIFTKMSSGSCEAEKSFLLRQNQTLKSKEVTFSPWRDVASYLSCGLVDDRLTKLKKINKP